MIRSNFDKTSICSFYFKPSMMISIIRRMGWIDI